MRDFSSVSCCVDTTGAAWWPTPLFGCRCRCRPAATVEIFLPFYHCHLHRPLSVFQLALGEDEREMEGMTTRASRSSFTGSNTCFTSSGTGFAAAGRAPGWTLRTVGAAGPWSPEQDKSDRRSLRMVGVAQWSPEQDEVKAALAYRRLAGDTKIPNASMSRYRATMPMSRYRATMPMSRYRARTETSEPATAWRRQEWGGRRGWRWTRMEMAATPNVVTRQMMWSTATHQGSGQVLGSSLPIDQVADLSYAMSIYR